MPIDNTATGLLRGLEYSKKTPYCNDSTTLVDLAQQKEQTNKTALTILLEDFDERLALKDSHQGSLTEAEAKKNFFEKKDSDNIFRSDDVQNYLEENPIIHQSDIFEQASLKNGGIKYANENDDIYQSALNFALSDINLVETTYEKEAIDWTSKKETGGKNELTAYEIKKYKPELTITQINDMLEKIDIDENPATLSAYEYASYLIAADGSIEFGQSNSGYCKSAADGLVSLEDMQIAANYTDSEFREYAQKIYNENYKN